MLTEEKLKARINYLGGTDAASVLGLSRWKTPLQTWGEKTGTLIPEQVDNLATEVGTELEDLVARLFTKRTGKKVVRVNETLFHPTYEFLGANIDRRVVGEDAIFEAKTAGAWTAKEWAGEDVPQEYIVQALHYLAVTGKARCYVAILIGGNREFKWKVVERDEKLIQDIVNKEVEFWTKYVRPKVMPKIVTKDDSDTLFKLFPNGDPGAEIVLGDDADKIAESIKALQSDAVALDGLIEKEKNHLKLMLGGNERGLTSKFKITWVGQQGKRLDVEAVKEELPEVYQKYSRPTTTRVLRIKEIKTEEK